MRPDSASMRSYGAPDMPERPDLEWVVPKLNSRLTGQRLQAVEVLEPIVVRLGVLGDFAELLQGVVIKAVTRRLHFVVFELDGTSDLTLAIHPMLAGRFQWAERDARRYKDTCVVFSFDEVDLRYRDDKKMGKVYLMPSAACDTIPGFASVGVDVLDPEGFTKARLAGLLKGRRDQVKLFLMDKGAVDSFGNAYADETLFHAGLHPKRRCSELSEQEIGRLHAAMVKTLMDARTEVARRAPAIHEKERSLLVVRNRKGAPCTRCDAPIRVVGVRGQDAFFCAVCQPDPKSRGFVNWRRPKN